MHLPHPGGPESKRVRLALSILCENPRRRTGLSTLFPAFVSHSLRLFPNVDWLIFAGPDQSWTVTDERVKVVRRFAANDRLAFRLWADHIRVPAEAKRLGAAALLTVGFCPIRRSGLPIAMHVFTVHHRHDGGGLRAAYRRWAINYGLKHAALIIANSQWTASNLGVSSPRLLVSYEGLDSGVFRPDGSFYPGFPQGSYLLWCSNFYRYKRVELVLSAYAQLPIELRHKHPLILVGGDWHDGFSRTKTLAQRLGLQNHTHFLGWVDDSSLPALYRGARAHVLSTEEETFGRTVLEAMASGCPCVLQDLPVLREVAGDAALFVDYRDGIAAGAALKKICTEEALVTALRTKGLLRASEFSFARLAAERVDAVLARLGIKPVETMACLRK